MHTYVTNILITLRLMMRDRMVLFFGYVFPLIFFFLFAQMASAGQSGGVAKQVVASVLIFGVLGNGFFGAGMRAVSDRESNILRRFKVAPTTAAPLLAGWLVVGWLNFVPSAVFLVLIGRFGYQMPWPERPFTLFLFGSLAVLAFRAMGLIIASVVNSMQESQILIQLFYLPMLFLSGATVPITSMPPWLQSFAQFIPSAHLHSGINAILVQGETLQSAGKQVVALLLTLCIGFFLSVKLFRWEKEQKVKGTAKLWVLAVLAPFLALGAYDFHAKEGLTNAKRLERTLRRGRTLLFRDVRLFVGDGRVIERGGLLVKEGKIEKIFEGATPEPKSVNADGIEGSGKTLLPGFIDAGVYLSFPKDAAIDRRLAAYLYCGVTTVRSFMDNPIELQLTQRRLATGELLGSRVVTGGHRPPAPRSAEYVRKLLEGSLAQQAAPKGFIDAALPILAKLPPSLDPVPYDLVETGSGLNLLIHGPALHRELRRMVEHGRSPADALRAATGEAADRLQLPVGYLRPGFAADLVLVDGNPLQDITVTERISLVVLQGERVARGSLFEEYDEK